MKSLSLLLPILLISIHHIRGDGIRIPLTLHDQGGNHTDEIFYGTISIGTPPQKINVLFSVFYGQNKVLSSYCNTSLCRAENHNTYNHKISTTFRGNDDFDTRIQKLASSAQADDTITIDKIRIQDALLWVYSDARQLELDGKPYDGIIGLSYYSDFLKYCYKLGLKKKFSIYTTYPRDNNTSELMLCGEDETKSRDLQYFTIDPRIGWEIKIQSVSMHYNDERIATMELSGKYIVLHHGSSSITGPEENIEKIYKALNATTSKISNLKEVDCKTVPMLPNITFRADDKNFTFTANDYIKQLTQNNQRVCLVRFVSHNLTTKYWILGNVFNRKFYTVFDGEMDRIGFAEYTRNGTVWIL